ncbi:MAG: hypothetical protein J5772_08055, partial [Clostridia bacterium]|nr:hypothetical protein [Clostridia bacterium]
QLRAEQEAAREAERRAAERARANAERLKYEAADEIEDEAEDISEEKSAGLLPFLGGIFKRKEKEPRRSSSSYEYEDEEEDYDDFEESYDRRARRSTRRSGRSGNGMNVAIRIAALIALLALLAVIGYLVVGEINKCSAAAKSPTGTTKLPVIEPSPKEDGFYYVTVYAKEGKTLVYESSDGKRWESTVDSSNCAIFNVPESRLMSTEPVEGDIYVATPTVYVKNDDGTETLVEGMPSVMLKVPALEITYDCPDNMVSEDGVVQISGRIVYIGTDLTIGGEKVTINQDGTFATEIVYEDTGDYTIDVEGRLPGYQIYRHSFNVTVERATPSIPLVQLPWEYGDISYSQRVKSTVDTVEVRGMVPVGSTLTASCSSSNASLTAPTVGDDGSFSFNAKLAYPGDYTILLTCTTESGQVSEREMHIQRAPDWSSYIQGALPMNFASFAYESKQGYNIRGTVTEILQEGDYYLAVLTLEDGNELIIEYHNHYGTAGQIVIGKEYKGLYGRPMGLNADGKPQAYIWFVEDN